MSASETCTNSLFPIKTIHLLENHGLLQQEVCCGLEDDLGDFEETDEKGSNYIVSVKYKPVAKVLDATSCAYYVKALHAQKPDLSVLCQLLHTVLIEALQPSSLSVNIKSKPNEHTEFKVSCCYKLPKGIREKGVDGRVGQTKAISSANKKRKM